MTLRPWKPPRPRGRGNAGPSREWVGGRFSPPFFIEHPTEPYRAELAIWLELPSGLIVGQELYRPKDTEGAVGRVLLAAMERPPAGPPRRPDKIRVGHAQLAAEVQAAIGDSIPIEVAPTPELDRLLDDLLESMPESDADGSYLRDGRIDAAIVKNLFVAAQVLYSIAPWKIATDDQALRMDIPALGIEGACVSIIGSLGQARGLIVFPSLHGYEAFRRVAAKPLKRTARLDMGTGWLALNFERKADLPATMRREAKSYGWPVAGADAYPRVERRDPDGASRPLVTRDLKIAAACASALSAFAIKHGEVLENGGPEPVCESYFDDDDLEVRFTFPYEAAPLFEVHAGPEQRTASPVAVRRARVGRNDPCPCGSGRKYKKCHGPLEERQGSTRSEGDAHHDLDAHWVSQLTEFGMVHFGFEWSRFAREFVDASQVRALAVPWSVYGFTVRGATVLDWYLEKHGQSLTRADRDWLCAQQAAWLAVWEVTAVEPGTSLRLRDLLTDETRLVREISGSRTLVVHDAVLARVVDVGEVSLLCGVHPRPLPPIEAAEVVACVRRRLRLKRAVPATRLRGALGPYLIRQWENAVSRLDARPAMPSVLQNTDGDPFLVTIDHFEIAPGAGSEVAARLAALEHVQPPEPAEEPPTFTFLRPGGGRHARPQATVVGVGRISRETLRIETNSKARADALRARIEAACGNRLRHRAREHADPLSDRALRGPQGKEVEMPPAEVQRALLEIEQEHYSGWVDEAIPALGGRTPREAVKTAGGRAAVDLLLKDFENRDRRARGSAGPDFSAIRRELRLE